MIVHATHIVAEEDVGELVLKGGVTLVILDFVLVGHQYALVTLIAKNYPIVIIYLALKSEYVSQEYPV